MRKFTHLTLEHRVDIERLLRSNSFVEVIAQHLGGSPATVYREFERGQGDDGYSAHLFDERDP